MALKSVINPQRDFSSGVIDFDGRRRDDTKIYRTSLWRGTNVRPLGTGGITDRPGRRFQYFTDGRPSWARPASGVRHKVTFGDGTFTARTADNVVNTTLAGCPWTEAMLPDLSVTMAENSIAVVHPDIPPQLLIYSFDDDEWTLLAFEFQEELSGEIRQPYYRFAAGGITMQPSALTGSVTVTFSDPVLVAGHIGTRFRYFDFEVEITAVASATSGTATAIRALPGSQRITLVSSSGFSEGDAVEGATTGATGVVAAIASGTQIDVVLETPSFGFGQTEVIVGPTARSTASLTANISPAAFTIWDEQLISAVRGYPSGVAFDRSRLMFYGFPLVGRAVLWSEVGNITGFNIGALASDGMFETLPINCVVQHVEGGADQFIYTDVGIFFIPISAASPLQPGSIEFREVSSDGSAPIAPARTREGSIFVNEARNQILALRATGQTAQPYVVEDISEYHRDLFSSPIAVVLGKSTQGQELVYVLNDDGTMVAGKLNKGEQIVGWFPWEGEGLIRYLAADRGDVLLAVEYEVDGDPLLVIEEEDEDALLDCTIAGDAASTLVQLAGLEVAVFVGDNYMGRHTIDADGSLINYAGDLAEIEVGFVFEADIMPFCGNVEGGESFGQRTRLRRVKKAHAVLNGTHAELEFCGRIYSSYRALDDQGEAAPRRNKTIRGKVLGRFEEPEIPLRRTQPGRLKLVELLSEVTI